MDETDEFTLEYTMNKFAYKIMGKAYEIAKERNQGEKPKDHHVAIARDDLIDVILAMAKNKLTQKHYITNH
jgi:hypothetical protein